MINNETFIIYYFVKTKNKKNFRYTLIAVVNHNGTTESGHYSCYIRHHREHWYKCNDHIISRERASFKAI